MSPSRRSFLAGMGAATLGVVAWGRARPFRGEDGTAAGAGPELAPGLRLDRLGVQLYTARRELAQDMAGTLERVAEIGYREVEFAGYFDHSPGEVRDLLARHGLAAPSTHVGYNSLERDWQRTLDDAAEIGHTYVTIPSLPAELRRTRDGWARIVEAFNRGAAAARAAGLRFAFHNHDAEFVEIDGEILFDRLLAGTDPTLVDFQMDVYWVTRAGHDPIAYLNSHGSRFAMLHLKDSAGPPDHRMVDVGSGSIDWSRLLAAAADAGVRHYFVEHDQPQDALVSIATSYRFLARPAGGGAG